MRDNRRLYGVKTVTLCAIFFVCATAYSQDERTQYFPKKTDYPKKLPAKKDVWIFILTGQSNMAGRGIVEPQDTLPDNRILTINSPNEIIVAKEPLHFYEPNLTGLDCGLSFANQILKNNKKGITVLLIPTAVGGSSSNQWLGDSLHRNVKLMTNFIERVRVARQYGTIKGILWHQGESDTNSESIPGYEGRLEKIFSQFRAYCSDRALPILIGELGSYSENQIQWKLINDAIHRYAAADKNAYVINTGDLESKADKIHFNSKGQRAMGQRMAEKFVTLEK